MAEIPTALLPAAREFIAVDPRGVSLWDGGVFASVRSEEELAMVRDLPQPQIMDQKGFEEPQGQGHLP